MEKGFILTGGNIFYHENAEVKTCKINLEFGYRRVIFCKTDEDFEKVHNFLKWKFVNFSVQANRCLSEGVGYFPISFVMKEEDYESLSLKIRDSKSVSSFIDATEY